MGIWFIWIFSKLKKHRSQGPGEFGINKRGKLITIGNYIMLYYKVETWKTWKLHYFTLQGKKLGKLGKQKKRKLTHHCA